jgi:toxin CcdB
VRFHIHALRAAADVPLVVDVEADRLDGLRTRVVIPLLPVNDVRDEVAVRLKPVIDVADSPYVLMTNDLGAFPTSALGDRVASIEHQRQLITDALDYLFQGF